MYLPHLNINSNPTPSTSTTNSTTYIKPSYSIKTALSHNTRLAKKNLDLQDALEKARDFYKELKQEREILEEIIDVYLQHPIEEYKALLEEDKFILP